VHLMFYDNSIMYKCINKTIGTQKQNMNINKTTN
jgi:hypothetical protein